jgi:hypothetical protein
MIEGTVRRGREYMSVDGRILVSAVAHHEAGHAVAIDAIGGVVTWVTIQPNSSQAEDKPTTFEAGHCLYVLKGGPGYESREMVGHLAGDISEDLFRGVAGPRLTPERLRAMSIVPPSVQGEPARLRYIGRADHRARGILIERWSLVQRIARALLVNLNLDATAFYDLVRAAGSSIRTRWTCAECGDPLRRKPVQFLTERPVCMNCHAAITDEAVANEGRE